MEYNEILESLLEGYEQGGQKDIDAYLKEIADNDDKIVKGAQAFIDKLAPSSIVVRLFAQTKVTNYYQFLEYKGNIIREIIHRFRAEGINFAFPSTSVYIEKTGEKK